MSVQHTGDSVEAEAIELVFVHPEAKVAQQKTHHFMVTIVEKTTVPLVMISFAAAVEVLMISSVKIVETIQNVL